MTPYRYFRDKDEILAAVRTGGLRPRLPRRSRRRPGRRAAISPQPDRPTGEAYVRFALDDPEAYRLMFDLSQPHPDRYPELVRASARARAAR